MTITQCFYWPLKLEATIQGHTVDLQAVMQKDLEESTSVQPSSKKTLS